MRQRLLFLPLLLGVLVVGCADVPEEPATAPGEPEETPIAPDEATVPDVEEAFVAKADIEGQMESGISGTVTLIQKKDEEEVAITAKIRGLSPGKHGFHIHEYGDCSAADFSSAGEHFNPEDVEHGGLEDEVHHAGDLGNILADDSGLATPVLATDAISLHEDATNSVIRKSLIVHEDEDDLETQPDGAAGARVGCGVIHLEKTPEEAAEEAET